ncbi:hypothetical protein [Flavisolibacter nicotianae]|uniref:hypothetical protein n=1 Tax=Flavisolibacter nicotianae TaxID=2364882 RepID=UPI000EAE81F7|nr:hypothetical protein [Flavisolibacter nicotianae]
MKHFLPAVIFFVSLTCHAQKHTKAPAAADSTLLTDEEILSALDDMADVLASPRSFAVVNLGVSNGYFNFVRGVEESATVAKKIVMSPSLAYFHKSGFGIAAETDIVNDGTGIVPFQFLLTGSYDYLRSRAIIAGASYSRYFEKAALPFYVSPLQNVAFAYFTYRESRLRPSLALHYGWGSQKAVTVQSEKIKKLRITRTITTINQVADFNLLASLRYTFSWPQVFSANDYLRVTPQLGFISGTQQFGFNQTSNVTATGKNSSKYSITGPQNLVLTNVMKFQPLSLNATLKTEYARGKFFLQPQAIFDYYLPAANDNFSVSFLVNTGMLIF